MDDNDQDIKALIEKYEQMRYMGKNIYFDSDEFAALAEYYYDFGDISEADDIADAGLEMHTGNAQLMIMKAKVLVFNQSFQEALDYLSGVSVDDNNVDYLLVKIESLLYLNKLEQANVILERVMNSQEFSDDDLYTFITEAGYLYNDIDEYEIAISLLENAHKIDDEDLELLIDLAYAYEMIDDFEKAIEFNNLMLDINPFSFDAWVNLGKLHSMLLQYDKAIEAFDFALTINDNEVNVLKMKALSHYLNDNVEEAIRLFRECLNDSPDDETLYDSLLEGYEVMEQYDEMLDVIAKKEEKFGSEKVYLQRAHVFLNQEKYEEAQEEFEKIPESEMNTFDYYVLEGELAIFNKDFATAEMAYMLAMIDSPDDELVIDKLANISLDQEKYEKAAEYLEQLLVLNPDFPTAKGRLAFIRFEIGAKEPFDEIMSQFTDAELRSLLALLTSEQNFDYAEYSREKMLIRLNEARENRVLFKNIKY